MNQQYYPLKIERKKHKKARVIPNLLPLASTLPDILKVIQKNFKMVKSRKTKNSVRILKLLDIIVPDEYFGASINRTLFYDCVKFILTQSDYECIHVKKLYTGFNTSVIPWLKNEKISNHNFLLCETNKYLLETIVKPLISFFYKPVLTLNANEIQFIRIEKWASFLDTSIHKLIKRRHLITTENQSTIVARGQLKIIPKNNYSDFRSVVMLFKTSDKQRIKRLNSILFDISRINKHFSHNLFTSWSKFVKDVGVQTIFAVKLDIKDAFGHIDISLLSKIILALPEKYLSKTDKEFIINRINNQYVIFRKAIYKWSHGLLQGDSLSSALCELYLTHCENQSFPEFPKSFMHRTVDDYLFCSTDKNTVCKFQTIVQNSFNVNKMKTESFEFTKEISYCGKIFNLETKETKIDFRIPSAIRHKFKFFNMKKQFSQKECKSFILQTMSFNSCSHYFSKLELNLIYNCHQTVLDNFFSSMIFVAYKFDAAVMTIRNNFVLEDLEFLSCTINMVVSDFSFRAQKIIKRNKDPDKTEIPMNLLKRIAFKSFILVLKRRNEVYKNVISDYLKKRPLRLTIKDEELFAKINFAYFTKIPIPLRNIKINRKCEL